MASFGHHKFYVGEFIIDGSTSKAYFKNLKRDFEKRVYVLLGHRKIPCTFKVEGPLRLVQRIKKLIKLL